MSKQNQIKSMMVLAMFVIFLSVAIFVPDRALAQLDFGDAPEGALAYPSMGVFGFFPTCMNVGPASWVQHTNFGAFFGPLVDFEPEGNGGLCPGFAPYDNDECFMDGDAGLLFPPAYTIDATSSVVPCPLGQGGPLGTTCTTAVWGGNIDIDVTNIMPNNTPGYVNVLIDWNQNGAWGGSSICLPAGTPAPEHVLINFVVPNPFSGPLSALAPPAFLIGPNSGYVWARFTISEAPVPLDWDGSAEFEDGESEDYLLHIEADSQVTVFPVVQTVCPVVETECPVDQTRCPVVATACPVDPTTCPVVLTECPADPTTCQAVETECPENQTLCPVIETTCPTGETWCPAVPTRCPEDNTVCPEFQTLCPVDATVCPELPTVCPEAYTECPVVDTLCPNDPTVCESTVCPDQFTTCPEEPTFCPIFPTDCPIDPTFCPTGQTTCEFTICDIIPTWCPDDPTNCPVFPTNCPVDPTFCPVDATTCPKDPTACPSGPTWCPEVATVCPVVPTFCPDNDPTICEITLCPAEPTICPMADTTCPEIATTCPAGSCGIICQADLDCNGNVGLSDLGIMKTEFGTFGCDRTVPSDCCQADIDNNANVGLSDLGTMKIEFGTFGCETGSCVSPISRYCP